MNKERELELVLEQCEEVVSRKIPLLVLAPEYTKILLDHIEELKEEFLKLEDKYIHNVPCCNEEDCDFYKKYKENEADLTTVYLKGYEDGKDLYNHYKLLYQKVKDRNDKAIEYINSEMFDYLETPDLLDILKGNNE